MSSAALFRALAVLAVLLAVWGAFVIFRSSVSDAPVGLELPSLGASDVDMVDIVSPTDTVRLERTDVRWTVNGHPAAAAEVSALFTALSDTGLSTELTARSAASHERLGVDSASGRRVRLGQRDRVLLDLIFGGRGRAWETAYVRRAGENDVFLMRGRLIGLVDRNAEAWRDRQIARVMGDSVRTILIERGRRAYALARTDAGWTIDRAPADTLAVRKLLIILADLSASGFASAGLEDSLDFATPDRRLTVLGAVPGDTLLALVVDSTGSGVWVRRAGGGPVYRLDAWRLEQIVPADSDLRAK